MATITIKTYQVYELFDNYKSKIIDSFDDFDMSVGQKNGRQDAINYINKLSKNNNRKFTIIESQRCEMG